MQVFDKRGRGRLLTGIKARVAAPLADESGAALILTGLALVALMGFSALVIDIGNAYQKGRTAQKVTDASALAGGWELPTGADAKTVAADYVAENLDVTLPATSTCPVEDDVTADTVCYEIGTASIQITSPWDNNEYMVRVEMCDDVATTFAGVIGFTTMTVCRHAIVEGEPPYPGSPGGPAIQSFDATAKKAFESSGQAGIWTNGDIFVGSNNGEAYDADGTGGVTALGDVWMHTDGDCVGYPVCGQPLGFISPPGNTVVKCDPAGITDPLCPGGLTHFDDYYATSAPRSIVFTDLKVCLESNFAAAGCAFYDPDAGYPTHGERTGDTTQGPLADLNTDPDNPTCTGAPVTMDPGHYSNAGAYKIKGCVIMNPGIYMFTGGLTITPAFLQANDVFIINAHAGNTAKVSKSAACLTGITGGSFANFLFYQNPANTNDFIITADSTLFIAGIVYNPGGPIEVNGSTSSAPWAIGGDGTAATGCLGETTLLGGSIVGTTVKVKSDGQLSINAFQEGAATGGGSWVRLYE